MPNNLNKVIIAGAGPGDPDLITVRAAAYLREADIILADRLANREILLRHANPAAEVIDVGKQAGRTGSMPQRRINDLLVDCAGRARLVVRLKGGDVSVFSNILDELEVLRSHGIPYEIIPGITAASGAAAYAGIPLTARDHARGVRLLTYYDRDMVPADQWSDLARTTDTLVFYMASRNLKELCARLLDSGADAAKPVALVEQATTPVQQVHLYTLGKLAGNADADKWLSPSLVIMGSVASLHERFHWFRNIDARIPFFDELGNGNGQSESSPSPENSDHAGRR
jgi:uroporphyrin-III C-methyltransferase